MNKKKKFQMKSKHLLVLMTFLCISAILLTFTQVVSVSPLREAASRVIVPFQNGINQVGSWMSGKLEAFRNTEELAAQNQELEQKIAQLTEENTRLTQNQNELQRLQELYQLDQDYSEYDKVAAQVISKDPGNWYDTFVINKGSADGIERDMNVIAAGGLVGLVTEVETNCATVRSIIDDSSSVSAMAVSTSDTCVVSGDLRLMDEGKLAFSQMSAENTVAVGEQIVTSNISDKYLRGILIGYISEVEEDSNHLTYTGYITPAVDFRHIQEVLVIKQLKQTEGE
ncbi:MAG TPA: rod shape-determining protein MreC [Candidatus Fusicatenibacter intestinigallinarum]|uniref:Cell shape-determining protein MreC n=1 Tax=Candidatus Fusicatenibacter intestinigallinarum TaxID=2838598 RepID=A0A9D2SM04_9FIRM|nr:rod shape-determining protein MreC [Candidatus Fusicatenibacter intestinigallinarum]